MCFRVRAPMADRCTRKRDVVELALDHAHDNEVARAYDLGERFDERVKLFQWWGKAACRRTARGDGNSAKNKSGLTGCNLKQATGKRITPSSQTSPSNTLAH